MNTIQYFAVPSGITLAVLFILLASCCLAAEQTIAIHDYSDRGFPPDLLEYRLHGAANPDKIRVFRADGTQIPCQVRQGMERGSAVLQFVTALPAKETVTYTARDAGGKRAAGSVQVARDGQYLVLSNALLAVRVPGEVKKTFNPPVAGATLPAPILAFRNSTGAWLGSSALLTQKTVKAMRVVLVNTGSVYAELSYETRLGGRRILPRHSAGN